MTATFDIFPITLLQRPAPSNAKPWHAFDPQVLVTREFSDILALLTLKDYYVTDKRIDISDAMGPSEKAHYGCKSFPPSSPILHLFTQ
jgi:hypothetical protein